MTTPGTALVQTKTPYLSESMNDPQENRVRTWVHAANHSYKLQYSESYGSNGGDREDVAGDGEWDGWKS